jgi:hypothetical protein
MTWIPERSGREARQPARHVRERVSSVAMERGVTVTALAGGGAPAATTMR